MDLRRHSLVVDVTATVPEGVVISPQTNYFNIERRPKRTSLAALAPGVWIAVRGRSTTGTVNAALVRDLRIFLGRNHVDDIVVNLGVRDSWEIGRWVYAAIGRPTRAGRGGLIWTKVPQRLAAKVL